MIIDSNHKPKWYLELVGAIRIIEDGDIPKAHRQKALIARHPEDILELVVIYM